MSDLVVRFLIGGAVVSVFSVLSDLFKPKTFAGLFGAAPSVALASLGLNVLHEGASTFAFRQTVGHFRQDSKFSRMLLR